MKHTQETKEKISRSLLGNKRGLGYRHTTEAKEKISEALKKRTGENHPMFGVKNELNPLWKGNRVKYRGLHAWVARCCGKASKCEQSDYTCKGRFEWSNISKEYKRDLGDWQQLCTSHHKRYDTESR
jgi:hypothetical protein